ncbi:TPA: hypothetical protein DEB00_02775 [Candidatus Uhrbacteria bacterium]|nr:hypothetical protein [Candidatus Uhrbacteria bacterium]
MSEFKGGPTEEERLRAMGSDRLLADLKRKYRQPAQASEGEVQKPEQSVKPSLVIDHLRAMQERKSELAALPFEHPMIPEAEMEQLSQAWQEVERLRVRTVKRLAGLKRTSDAYRRITKEAVDDIVAYLDQQPVWRYKFATQSGGAPGEISNTIHSEDSLYYLSEHGASIRLKRSALYDENLAWRHVIQPIMELTLFSDSQSKGESFSRVPLPGYSVRDFETPEFADRLRDEEQLSGYVSELRVHEDHGVPRLVSNIPEGAWDHLGDPVSVIIDTKQS